MDDTLADEICSLGGPEPHGRHAHLLGHLVDSDIHAGMDEAKDGVVDRLLDLAPEHPTLLVAGANQMQAALPNVPLHL
jgi:hypothetical protein